jgi:hypothetical protein
VSFEAKPLPASADAEMETPVLLGQPEVFCETSIFYFAQPMFKSALISMYLAKIMKFYEDSPCATENHAPVISQFVVYFVLSCSARGPQPISGP